jgi:ubiquinone/menaquinone biosynthesis C-methylase UbiE
VLVQRSIAIAQQSGNPQGILGRIIAFIMSFETKSMNQIGLDLLDLRPNDKALEVGFGHGKTISKGSMLFESGMFSGIDISKTMLSVAEKKNKRLIDEGKVELKLAGVENIPYEDNYFDKVITVHTIYFWKDPSNSIKELHRVMKPGARLVIGFRFDPNAMQSFPAEVYTFFSDVEVSSMLKEVGFSINQCKKDINGKRSLYWLVGNKNVQQD